MKTLTIILVCIAFVVLVLFLIWVKWMGDNDPSKRKKR